MEPFCMAGSHTNNLPTPTDLTKNHYGKKLVFKTVNKKSAAVLQCGIGVELVLAITVADFLKNVLIFETLGGC